jgi:hypothetical protein
METAPTQLNRGMKYAEVTIIKNIEHRGFFNTIFSSLGMIDEETIVNSEHDIIVMKFDDEELPFSVNDRYVDCEYKAKTGYSGDILYFNKRSKKAHLQKDTIFFETPNEKDGKKTLNFNVLKNFETDTYPKIAASINNTIMYTNDYAFSDVEGLGKNHFYGITRMESSETKPRYYVAYKAPYITKEEVIYITKHHLLRNWNPTNIYEEAA